MLNDQVVKNVDELLEKESSSKLVRVAIYELKLEKSSVWQYVISLIIALILGIYIGLSEETITLIENAVEIFNSVDIAFIAMIIGSYSVFQALLSDDFLIALIRTDNNLLKISNKSFFNLVILYLVGIFINIILLVFLNLVGEQWVLFPGKHNFNNFLASTLCVIYLFYNSMIILEIKNFATNLYRMFNASNSQRIVNIIAKKENEKNKES